MMFKLHTTGDLLTSGLGFSMRNEEAPFEGSGEISGLLTLVDESYEPHTCVDDEDDWRWCRVCNESGPQLGGNAVEDFALMDDGDRWGHLKDAYLGDWLNSECLSMQRAGDDKPDYGVYRDSVMVRYRRCCALIGKLRKLETHLRAAVAKRRFRDVRYIRGIIANLANGVNTRYRASVQLIVERGRDEWYLLYLKKDQRAVVLRRTQRLLGQCITY